jgi:hypothetical protein
MRGTTKGEDKMEMSSLNVLEIPNQLEFLIAECGTGAYPIMACMGSKVNDTVSQT